MSHPDSIRVETVQLERLAYLINQCISQKIVQDLVAVPPRTEVFFDHICHGVVVQVRQEILAEHLDRATVRYPQDWWEAFKEHLYAHLWVHWPWGIEYAKKRWPVLYRFITMESKALYPRLSIPNHKPIVTVLRHEKTNVKEVD